MGGSHVDLACMGEGCTLADPSQRADPSQEQLGIAAYETAKLETETCEAFSERRDMYRVAAEAGHTESRVRWVVRTLRKIVCHAYTTPVIT